MRIRNVSIRMATAALILASWLPSTAVADTFQSANMLDFDSSRNVRGAATMTRSMNSVKATIATTGLHWVSAYTVWWVIWNDPSKCNNGACGDDDLDFGVEGNSVFYAGGFVTGFGGIANINLHLEGGVVPDAVDVDGLTVLIPGGLDIGNGYGAEIHLVVRSHRGVRRSSADLQISTYDGACGPAPDYRRCKDHQAVAFAPVAMD